MGCERTEVGGARRCWGRRKQLVGKWRELCPGAVFYQPEQIGATAALWSPGQAPNLKRVRVRKEGSGLESPALALSYLFGLSCSAVQGKLWPAAGAPGVGRAVTPAAGSGEMTNRRWQLPVQPNADIAAAAEGKKPSFFFLPLPLHVCTPELDLTAQWAGSGEWAGW